MGLNREMAGATHARQRRESERRDAERQAIRDRDGRPDNSFASDVGLSYARGVLDLRGSRAIVMTEQAYILLLRILHEHAPHIMKYAFYDMGYRAGIDIMASLEIPEGDAEEAFRQYVQQYMQAGYGAVEVTHFELTTPEVRLRGHNLFEAGLAPAAGIYRSPRVVDHYSRGMFAGFTSELLKREVVCEEIACEFRGDPSCEFVVLPFQE